MAEAIYLTPRGGLEHRVFESSGPGDQFLAAYAFEPPLDEAGLAAVQRALDVWSHAAARAEPDEPVHCDEPFLSPRTLRIRVHNLLDPRAALGELSRVLGEAAPVREAHHSRWRALPEREEPSPVLDPDAPVELSQFADHAGYLRAVFDPASPPPASGYEGFGRGAFETRTGDIVLEDRGMPLHLAPLRLCYGTARARFLAPDSRSQIVRDALAPALERAFSPLAQAKTPRFFDHAGALGEIDRIEAAGQRGYGFAFASPELIQRLANTHFRYREHELFEALIPLVESAKLAPVATWQRFGRPFAKSWKSVEMHVLQLWEPG
jgi:hypothetical protein